MLRVISLDTLTNPPQANKTSGLRSASTSDHQEPTSGEPKVDIVVAAIRDAFDELTQKSDETSKGFQDILAELANIAMIGEDHQLYKRWNGICEDFQSVLRDSHRCASSVSARMKTFYRILARVVFQSNQSKHMKVQAVSSFVEACKRNEAREIEIIKKFEHIFNQINNFEKALAKYVRDNKRDIVNRDSAARCFMVEVNDDLSSLWIKLGVIAVGAAATVVAFGTLVVYKPTSCITIFKHVIPLVRLVRPGAMLLAGFEASSGISTYISIRGKKRENAELTTQLEWIGAKQTQINNMSEQLADLQKGSLTATKEKVELFTIAWRCLIGGCVQLQETIEASEDYVDNPELFALSLNYTCELYKAMVECLDAYAAGFVGEQ